MKYKYSNKKGFTLLEVLIVIGILAVLSAAVLVAVNPTRQFKLARDSQRVANVSAIANAISQSVADNKGVFPCDAELGAVETNIGADDADIAACLVPDYISTLPINPGYATGAYISAEDYDTGYNVMKNATGRIVVSTDGEITPHIEAVR